MNAESELVERLREEAADQRDIGRVQLALLIEEAADALLRSADLLAACKALARRWEPERGGTDHRIWEEAWEAIRKAESSERSTVAVLSDSGEAWVKGFKLGVLMGRSAAAAISAESDIRDACHGLLGLLTLVCARDDMPADIRDALVNNHRVLAVRAALGDRP